MSQTKMRAGRAVAAYVQNGLGRRLVIAEEGDGYARKTIVLALTQAEAREAITALKQLAEELPP